MRDDLPPHPAFQSAAPDEDRPLEFRPSYNPVQPPEPISPWRVFAVGGVAACALGVVAAFAIPGHHGGERAQAKAATAPPFRPINARYAPPDRDRIASAYEDTAQMVSSEGLSGAARGSMACFERLTQHPDYGLMDYCLALDAFGAQAYARAAGEAAPPSTYFGQGSVRRQQAVQMLTAGQTDANSRLIDTNRLIQEVALQAMVGSAPQPQVAAITAAPVAEVPAPGPAPALPAAQEKVKVFRPEPVPIKTAAPAPIQPAKPMPIVLRPKPTPAPAKPKPAPAVIRVKGAPVRAMSVKAIPVKATRAAAPAKPPRLAKFVKVKQPAPTRVMAAAPVRARPASAKARIETARAGPPKPALTKSPAIKLKPQSPPDSTPWMTKLEAVLKRPAPAETKPGPAAPKDAPAAGERKSPAATGPAKSQPPEPEPAVARLAAPPASRQEARRDDPQPSFDCRSAVSRGQRLVCNEPALAAADRRLSSAFNRALNETGNPRGLIAEQNRWLALRDQLAPNYQAVMNLYQDRIAELRQPRY